MKKLLLIFVMTMALTGLQSQVIENFESITMNIFSGGTNGAISVIPNPDASGINTSGYVGKMIRGFDGDPWAGWYATMYTPVDVTANRYVHVKLWKPRVSPVVFKYEGAVNSGDVFPMTAQALTNQWEELVFDMSVVSGPYVKIVLIPDFETPLTLTEDIVIYYDDIYANDDPTVGSAPVQVMEDFENIPLNYLLGGAEDQSSMVKVPNPDMSGANLSKTVIQFLRDKDGVPWGGFWSNLPQVIDVTTNKYVHVKVWKPRISAVKFKIEGGAAGTIEIESMYPQTLTNAWEDIVFDFSEKTGEYPIIALLPDVMDPVGLEEDIIIYFDDIVLSNDSTPVTGYSQTINVDMTESGMVPDSTVWIAGTLGGIYGIWDQPGTNPNNQMLDGDGDGIYSITLTLPEELFAFKFFWGSGWGNGDPAAGGDRVLVFSNPMEVTYKWGIDGLVPTSPQITFICNMQYQIAQGNFIEGTDFMDIAGSFNEWNGENHHLASLGDGKYGITVGEVFTAGETIEFKFRINGSWDTSEFPGGGPNRTYTVIDGAQTFEAWYNNEATGINEEVQKMFNIYPNPISGTVTIGNMNNVNKIEIYSVTGKLVKSIEYVNSVDQTTINTEDLTSGMYIMTLFSGNSTNSTKLLKY